MASPDFKTEFDPRYGESVELVPGIARLTANNPSPFTFHGTNTYLLGDKRLAVIDPGPNDSDHLSALVKSIAGRPVDHILVTHTHMDHSPLAKALQEATGAPILAEGPHCAARDLNLGETNVLDASGDKEFVPDQVLQHGDLVKGDEYELTSLFTPGHTANHMAFAINGTDYLFSGDHVMAWATSIVAPPDGSMRDYMASLEILLDMPQQTYFSGHVGRLNDAHKFVRALRAHRRMRETAVLDQVRKGQSTIPEMVAIIYRNTDPRLHKAAGLSVFAHLEDLVDKELVQCVGDVHLGATFTASD